MPRKIAVLILAFISSMDLGVCWVFTEIRYPVNMALEEEDPQALDNTLLKTDFEVTPDERLNLIYPGTKWCGAGDIAENENDLGVFAEADACCRAHDRCPDSIPGGATRYNLTNEKYYTRLSCACDEKFRQCLRRADTKTANNVGVTYFNVIGTQCFRKDYPITGCNVYSGLLGTKCIEYSYDTSGRPRYQWFDVPNYYKKI